MKRTFENANGIQLTDAPLFIMRAGKQTQDEDVVRYDDSYIVEAQPQTVAVYYQVLYFVSDQAIIDGKDYLLFDFINTVTTLKEHVWQFDWDATIYDGLTLEQACEKHFRNCVFPVGQIAGAYYPTEYT